jgi:hypothetical protein
MNMGPALGLVPMTLGGHPSSDPFGSVFGGIGDGFSSVFSFPGKVLDTFGGLGHDLIGAPAALAHEAGSAFTGGIGAVGSTITGVAAEAGGAIGNVAGAASDLLSSPVLLIGGAALVLILLSR